MKRRFIALIILICCLCSVYMQAPVCIAADEYGLISADFENGVLPEILTYEAGMGSVENVTMGEKRAMFLNHEQEGGTVATVLSFDDITDGILTAEISVLQPTKKTDGEILFSLSGDSQSVVSVETNGGNISLRLADGSYQTIISQYFYNKWYALKIETDIINQSVNVYVNNISVISGAAFLSDIKECDELAFISNKAPGFMLDYVRLYGDVEIASLSIKGAAVQAIPPNEPIEYEYVAEMLSSGGNLIADSYDWSLDAEYSGVEIISMEGTDSHAKLKVSKEAVVGTVVTLIATSRSNTSVSASFAVTLSAAIPNRIEIKGDRHLSTTSGRKTEFTYSARVFDTFDNELSGVSLNWELQYAGGAELSFDNNTLKLTVSGIMPDEDEVAVLTVSLASNPSVYTNFNMLVQPYDVYYNDLQRLKTVKISIDSILKAGTAPNGNNPLISCWINPYSDSREYLNFEPDGNIAYSDLTSNFMLLRAMTGLSNLTGDESYQERVLDMYRHYEDYGYTPNGLRWWGNHTYMDTDTGMPFKAYETETGSGAYHEVERRDIYFDAWYEVDKTAALEYCKNYWLAVINDWSNYCFNRHAISNKTLAYNIWEEDSFVSLDSDFPFAPSEDLSFNSTGGLLLRLARERYEQLGDQDALRHAINLAYQYLGTVNPRTNLYGGMFTTPHRMPNRKSIVDTYGDNWWTWLDGTLVSGMDFGDRAYNMLQPLFSEGYVTTDTKGVPLTNEEKELIFEATLISEPRSYEIEMLMLAKAIGEDTSVGSDIISRVIKKQAADIDYFYDFEQNRVSTMRFTNGAALGGLKNIRCGYYGATGSKQGYTTMTGEHMYNLINMYEKAHEHTELASELETIWKAVKNMADKIYRVGDIGNPFDGEEPNMSMGVTSTDPNLIRSMIYLYKATGMREYLNLARVVGNNIINNLFIHGYIIPSSDSRSLQTDGEYQWALLELEETLLGESGLVPDSEYINAQETQMDFYDENMRLVRWNSPWQMSAVFDSVLVSDVTVEEEEIVLSSGETYEIFVDVYPNDASSKALMWEIGDRSVVTISDDNVITAKKPGETIIYAVATGNYGIRSRDIKIIVK